MPPLSEEPLESCEGTVSSMYMMMMYIHYQDLLRCVTYVKKLYLYHNQSPPNTTGVLGHQVREVCYYGGGSQSTQKEPQGHL